jgi:hypothetical protein
VPQPICDFQAAVRRQQFLILEGNAVRGGFALRVQPTWIKDRVYVGTNLQAPVFEGGTGDSSGEVAAWALEHILREQPLAFTAGSGGAGERLPRFLAGRGWKVREIPLAFRAVKVNHLLRQLPALHRNPFVRVGAQLARVTGFGAATLHLAQGRPAFGRRPASLSLHRCQSWEEWSSRIWELTRRRYTLATVRDSATLACLYPSGDRWLTLRATYGGQHVGWAVLHDGRRRDDVLFGNLRVGTIVDLQALPGHEAALVRAVVERFEARGVDLIVTTQSHRIWRKALGKAGFLAGGAGFYVAVSPMLAGLLDPFDSTQSLIHFNPGDLDPRFTV